MSMSEALIIDGDKTVETDETYKAPDLRTIDISNEEFLEVVQGATEALERRYLVSFPGDPTKVANEAWAGKPWPSDGNRTDLGSSSLATHNNYFSLATFNQDAKGNFRRKKGQFHSLSAIMLDDLGEKIALKKLKLIPSWLIETSKDNYQAGFILKESIKDPGLADRLMSAIIDAGLCDRGANGPTTRLARLPVGSNGKHDPPFKCRLAKWNPQLRYSVDDLVAGLDLKLEEPGGPRQRKKRNGSGILHEDWTVHIPRPTENVVVAALIKADLYKESLGGGRHDMTCPWVGEHTDVVDGGTAYFEPDENFPLGGFHCFHGHCAERTISDLLGYLKTDPELARMKPTIRVLPGEMHRVVDAAEAVLAESKAYYQRGGLIVMVLEDPGTGEIRLQELNAQSLIIALARLANFEKFDPHKSEFYRIDPPEKHTKALLMKSSYSSLPVLRGLARQPYLRPDGTIMAAAGYDPATGLYGIFDSSEFHIPEEPTRADATYALDALQDLLVEFAFEREVDKAAALAAMLTAVTRPSIGASPLFHARAHTIGSGKSYLCELIAAFAAKTLCSPMAFPGDDEECRKLLLAELLRSPSAIVFDNLTGDLLPHKSLCTSLTSDHLSGRILGLSKTASVSTRTLFMSSGNNVGPIADMTRRCVVINLDPKVEIPATRTFHRPDLLQDVLQMRGRYVSQSLTIVRAWLCAGRPMSDCKQLAGFKEWSDLCRQPLLWLGMEDPATSLFEAITDDPDRLLLGRLLFAWKELFGDSPTGVKDLMKQKATSMSSITDQLEEALREIAEERGEINRRRLGWWLKTRTGKPVDGLRLMPVDSVRSSSLWKVETLKKDVSAGGQSD